MDEALVFGIFGAPFAIYSFFAFDRLVRAEYENHRDIWMKDKEPIGFFFTPVGVENSLRRANAGKRLCGKLFFKTPPWIEENALYRSWLRQMRFCTVIWNMAIVSAGIVLFFK